MGDMQRFYPIGTPGQPWTDVERVEWFAAQSVKRSYADEVLAAVDSLDETCQVTQYGALSIDPERYPLHTVTVTSPKPDAPWVLITGGVHGYETSGVQGALRFLQVESKEYVDRVNFLVAPCVSPWGYEVINRWNPKAIDPNRSFYAASPSEEAAMLMALVASRGVDFVLHMDLHETTDTDESEFRPARATRDGERNEPGTIPDGFYLCGDTADPQPDFQAAIIAGVARVTHIAPADENGQIIGDDVTQPGVINYPYRDFGLSAGMTDAPYRTTTEVYPDSPSATDEICIEAQVAAVRSALDFVLAARG